MSSKTNPEVLKWLRYMAELTMKDASEKTGFDEATIEKWESEESDLSVDDIRRLSEGYEKPLGFFLLDKIPAQPEPLLHVYGQGAHHDEVFIVGNLEGLGKLYDALDSIINGPNEQAGCEVTTSDGEWYETLIIFNNDKWLLKVFKDPDTGKPLAWSPEIPEDSRWRKLAVPYTEDYAAEQNEDAVWPHKLWKMGEKND